MTAATDTPRSPDQLAIDLVPVAAQLVATVRDHGLDAVEGVLRCVPEGRFDALAIVLAAMVDPDRTPSELLAWTDWHGTRRTTTEHRRLTGVGVPAPVADVLAGGRRRAAGLPPHRSETDVA